MRRLLVFLGVILGLSFAVTPMALAATNPFDDPKNPERVCQKPNAAQSSLCTAQSGNPISGSDGILLRASRIVAFVGGVAAIIIIIVGGFLLVTAGGDSSKVSKARAAIIGAVIGLVIIILAQAIITFVINRVL